MSELISINSSIETLISQGIVKFTETGNEISGLTEKDFICDNKKVKSAKEIAKGIYSIHY